MNYYINDTMSISSDPYVSQISESRLRFGTNLQIVKFVLFLVACIRQLVV